MVGLSDGGGEVGEVAEGMADGRDGTRAGVEVCLHMDGACEEVEFDFISILHGGDGATDSSLGAAMYSHGATRDTRDTGV